MMGLGTTERAEVRSCTIGMRTDSIGSADTEVDTNLFSVWSAKVAVRDLGPGRLAIGKFCSRLSVVIMLVDGVAQFTAEDAADRVTQLSAALRK
jgi:hypothetical protein